MSTSETTSNVGMACRPRTSGEIVAIRAPGRYPSGQRGQAVNLLRKLRWFESNPAHSTRPAIVGGPIAVLTVSEACFRSPAVMVDTCSVRFGWARIARLVVLSSRTARPGRGLFGTRLQLREELRGPRLLPGPGRVEAARRGRGPRQAREGHHRRGARSDPRSRGKCGFDAAPKPSLEPLLRRRTPRSRGRWRRGDRPRSHDLSASPALRNFTSTSTRSMTTGEVVID